MSSTKTPSYITIEYSHVLGTKHFFTILGLHHCIIWTFNFIQNKNLFFYLFFLHFTCFLFFLHFTWVDLKNLAVEGYDVIITGQLHELNKNCNQVLESQVLLVYGRCNEFFLLGEIFCCTHNNFVMVLGVYKCFLTSEG